LDHRAAQGGLVGRAYALEQARSLGPTLRLLLGRRHPCASPARGGRAVPAGDHRRHARRQKGTCRARRRRARERAIVERAPPRPQTAGLAMGPELAVADGALGFWQAVEEVWPRTRGQRCWVHKTANVLNKLLKSQIGNRSMSISSRTRNASEASGQRSNRLVL